MSIKATTYVIFPVGTNIELYQGIRPSIGDNFNITHMKTEKVVQKAMVTKIEEWQPNWFRILAVITWSSEWE